MPQTPYGIPTESAPPSRTTTSREPLAPKGYGQEVDPAQAPPSRTATTRKPLGSKGYGQEIDPAQAPPKRAVPEGLRQRPPLQPIEVPPPGSGVAQFRTVALGLVQNEAPQNIPPGATPSAQNVLAREGVLEPRYRQTRVGSGSSLADDVLAMGELTAVSGTRYPYAISATTFSYYSGSQWTFGPYAANGVNDPPSGADTAYIDSTVIYDPVSDENAVVWVNGTDQACVASTYTHGFSSMTNAPICKAVAAWDGRVLYGNVKSGNTFYVQRIQYSEKFSPSITTTPTGGFDDLMDARGAVQRLMPDGDRLLVLFDHEIWYGLPVDYPFNVQYTPLDRTVGSVSPWTACQTPRGVFFLGDNYMPYIIPRGGGPQAVGLAVWKTLRDEMDTPARAHAEFNPDTGEVYLAYCVQGGTARPTKVLALNLDTGTWTPQTFAVAVTRFGVGDVTTSAVTWGGLVGTWAQQTQTWSQLGGTSSRRGLYAGTSTGTVVVFTSDATGDLGQSVEMKYLVVMPNEDPSRKLYLRELRLDYRAASASSLTLRLSDDFGSTFRQEIGVAFPMAPISAQTVIHVGMEAAYPTIQFWHDQGHRFAIQRAIAQVAPTGRG